MHFFTASLLTVLALGFTSAQQQPFTCSDPTYPFCCSSYLKLDNPIVKAILGSSNAGNPIMGYTCERVQGEVTAATTCSSGKTLKYCRYWAPKVSLAAGCVDESSSSASTPATTA